MIMYDMYYKYL